MMAGDNITYEVVLVGQLFEVVIGDNFTCEVVSYSVSFEYIVLYTATLHSLIKNDVTE